MEHIRNHRISFDSQNHIYYVDNQKVSLSVTEFVSKFFPKFDTDSVIDKWYEIWQTNETHRYFGMSKEEIKEAWRLNGLNASQLGTQLHEAIEQHAIENKVSTIPEFQQYLEFSNDYKEFEVVSSEWVIFDEELDIAGTVDRISKFENKYYIFDWKRTPEIKEVSQQDCLKPIDYLPNADYWKYCLQLNMYKYILEKNYGVEIEGMYLVSIHPKKNSYEVKPVGNMRKEIEEIIKFNAK